jgi:hypothetical protein
MALSVHTADNGVQHTVITADDRGWHVKIGTIQSDGFKTILNVRVAVTVVKPKRFAVGWFFFSSTNSAPVCVFVVLLTADAVSERLR